MFDVVPPALVYSEYPFLCISDSGLTLPSLDVTSSVTYNSSAPLAPAQTVDAYYDVDDMSLVPVAAIPEPPQGNTIQLVAAFATMQDGTNRAMFNGITYNSPLVPAILSELTLGPNATIAKAYGPSSFILDHNDVIDIVIQNGDVGKHPL